ncbi:shikimate dehydrogenase family protein [Microbacterium sp.]|uniref:shikimate dehydrogenase family protein n=1 Tax=Microbacterium sp. TaxID=51671 RepID=UPI0039E5520D
MPGTRLEVWGDPIAHSLSPAIHAAAYARLGWDWSYGRRRVDEASFDRELARLDAAYRGLSLTMPLKGAAFRVAVHRDTRAEATGAVNTLVLAAAGPLGFNTDVGGIVRALDEAGVDHVARGRIVGAGATATSALVALAELGADEVEVVARRPEAIETLRPVAARCGVVVRGASLAQPAASDAPLTISTLPGGAELPEPVVSRLADAGGILFDVVYGHGATALATAWQRAGGRVLGGEGMLLHQAVLQIRLFGTGDVDAPLPGEEAVLAAMRGALVGG